MGDTAFDKTPLVIDIGSSLTKIGYASESFPRLVLKTLEFTSHFQSPLHSSALNRQQWTPVTNNLARRVLLQELLVAPGSRKILLLLNPFCPTPLREALAESLLMRYKVPSLSLGDCLAMPAVALGVGLALVVDIGYMETRVAVTGGTEVIRQTLRTTDLGSMHVNAELRSALEADNGIEKLADLTNWRLEALRVKCCYVRSGGLESTKSLDWPLTGDTKLVVSSSTRWRPYDVFFESDTPIEDLVIGVLKACSVDLRLPAARHIILAGGSADARGFRRRFSTALLAAVKQDPEISFLAPQLRLIGGPEYRCLTAAWKGGSLLRSAEGLRELTARDMETGTAF